MKKIIMIAMALLTLNTYASDNKADEKPVKKTISEQGYRKPFDVDGTKYIIRPLFGVSTTSDFGEILTAAGHKKDPNNGRIAGIQVERYVFKRPLDLPVNVTLRGGYILHMNRYDKNGKYSRPEDANYYTNKDSHEINFGVKIYWLQFPWDKYVRTRIGISEGLSYISRVPNLERRNQYHQNNSNLLNYIDLTLSLNAKDITRINYLENTYVGMGVSHRSGIFGTINGVSGGGNNITFFFETEL